MHEPGRAIGRDISRGEGVEHELDAFIEKRDKQRRQTEGERQVEDAWRESERREEARRREENRVEWHGYFCRLAACLRARAEEYDRRAQTLMQDEPKGAG